MRIAFMGTPEFAVPSLMACLQVGEVVGVFTQPDREVGRKKELTPPAVKKKALELNLPVFQPTKLKTEETQGVFRRLNPDLLVVVAYGRILPDFYLNFPKHGAINVHASLLPRWRGAAPIHWALWNGDLETGVCTQKMVAELDAGDVIREEKISILPKDTTGILFEKLSNLGGLVLEKTITDLLKGEIQFKPQKDSEVSFAPKILQEHQSLFWFVDPAERCERQIRALLPQPVARIFYKDSDEKKMQILIRDASVSDEFFHEKNGFLFEAKNKLYIGCEKNSFLELHKIQPEGKKEMSAQEWLNGQKSKNLKVDYRLEKL